MSTSKQDRRIAADRAAKGQAEAIIEAAVERVKAKRGTLDPALAGRAAEVKAARDQGTAWWRIAHDLGLPGSADNVTQGKAGAALARKIYAAAYGALPVRRVSERTLAKRAERHEGVKAIKAQPRAERVEAVRTASASVIDPELGDEAVVEMLRGRVITWSTNLADMDGGPDSWSDQEACIHPRWCRIVITRRGYRCVTFKELDTSPTGVEGKAYAKANPGAVRTVRLDRIHNIGRRH